MSRFAFKSVKQLADQFDGLWLASALGLQFRRHARSINRARVSRPPTSGHVYTRPSTELSTISGAKMSISLAGAAG